MAKEDPLFALVKSLTRSEKRYFKIHFRRQGKASNYIRLFDAIAEQDVYNEAAIKRQFLGEPFVRQFHVTKYYLRSQILKSLRNFHSQISKKAEVKDLLRNIEILFHKELYVLCEAELKKAAHMANTFELLESLYEIASWKRKLKQALSPYDFGSFKKTLVSQSKVLDKLYNTNRYWHLAVDLSRELAEGKDPNVPDQVLLHDPENAWSLEAKVLHFNANYFLYLNHNDLVACEATLYRLLELLEGDPERLGEDLGLYASSANNLINFLVYQKKYEQALNQIQRAKKVYGRWLIAGERKTLFKQVMRTYNAELEIYRDTRFFKGNEVFLETVEGFVKENRHKMPPTYLHSFWFQLANIHFMIRNFDESLVWINELLNTRYKSVRMDLQIQVRMLNLMIHFEQQNMFVLRYFVENTRRFLKKRGKVEAYASILLSFFSKIAQSPLSDYGKTFVALQASLFPADGTEVVPASVIDYIDFEHWISEHTTNVDTLNG